METTTQEQQVLRPKPQFTTESLNDHKARWLFRGPYVTKKIGKIRRFGAFAADNTYSKTASEKHCVDRFFNLLCLRL